MDIYLVAVIAVLLILYIKFYNRLRRLSVKVQEGSAGIDVALEKRYDMLSEEIEAVKKYLAHEYQIYTEVTSTRAGKKLNESIFQEKKQLSEEAVKAISETITEQQKQMETIRQQLDQQRGQDNSLGAETPGMGGDADRTSGKSGSETWLACFRPAGTHRGQLCHQCTG